MLKLIQAVSGSADAGELSGLRLPWKGERVLQNTSLCKEALELHCTSVACMQHSTLVSADQRLRAAPFLQCLLFVSSRQKGRCALGAGKGPAPQVHMGAASVAG